MPIETKTCFPKSFNAGDAFIYKTSFTGYPASGLYVTALKIQAATGIVSVAGVASDDAYTFTLTSAITGALGPQDAAWAILLTMAGSDRKTVEQGVVTIYEDMSEAHVPTVAEALLVACEAAITFLSANRFSSTSFNGQSTTYADMQSLIRQRTMLQAEVKTERRRRFRRLAPPSTGNQGIRFNAC